MPPKSAAHAAPPPDRVQPPKEKENREAGQKEDPPTPEDGVQRMWGPLRLWCKALNYISSSLPLGPKCIKMAHVVNFQKCATAAVCLWMMRKSGNTSPTASMYLALHGGYGLCWLLKEIVFPDPKWQQRITPGSAVAIFGMVLGPYWGIAYNAIMRQRPAGAWSGKGVPPVVAFASRSNVSLALAGMTCMVGLTLMVGADAQKYFVLKREKGLITDGFFRRIRHPNYLGEMMIYGSFAFVSSHWTSWAVCGYIWSLVFVPWMLQKEARMSRYPQWKEYKARSGLLLPIPREACHLQGGGGGGKRRVTYRRKMRVLGGSHHACCSIYRIAAPSIFRFYRSPNSKRNFVAVDQLWKSRSTLLRLLLQPISPSLPFPAFPPADPMPNRKPHVHPPPDTSKVLTETPNPTTQRRSWVWRKLESLGWDTGVLGLEPKEIVGLTLFMGLSVGIAGYYLIEMGFERKRKLWRRATSFRHFVSFLFSGESSRPFFVVGDGILTDPARAAIQTKGKKKICNNNDNNDEGVEEKRRSAKSFPSGRTSLASRPASSPAPFRSLKVLEHGWRYSYEMRDSDDLLAPL
eukprot:gene13461-9269_t